MLLPLDKLVDEFKLNIKGVIHVGAHHCEELESYLKQNINKSKIVWIEAQASLVQDMLQKDPDCKIYCAVISSADNEFVEFITTNNGQSSSILELKDHKKYYPEIVEVSRNICQTKTVDTLLHEKHEDLAHYNFLNIDIQGAELLALRGMPKLLQYIEYIYLEVNTAELYANCAQLNEIDAFLATYGFVRKRAVIGNENWGDAFYIKTQPQTVIANYPATKYITCNCLGRLGNQMFQVATVLATAFRQNMKPIFPENFGEYAIAIEFWRKIFNNFQIDTASVQDFEQLQFDNYSEDAKQTFQMLPSFGASLKLSGFFQTAQYFNDFESQLKRVFSLPLTDMLPIRKCIQNIRDNSNQRKIVSLHIRATDYIDLGWQLPISYFMHALSQFSTEDYVVLLFSDDIQWCRKHLPVTLKFLTTNEELHRDYQELYAMSLCDAHIVSNSTFAWWAAYLGSLDNKSKMIVAPNKWCEKFSHNPLIIPDNWIKIRASNWVSHRRSFHKYKNSILVESGTFMGDGIQDALNCGFNKVISFEVAPALVTNARRRFANNHSVMIIQDTSANLYQYISDIKEPITFWLDGHWSQGDTSFQDVYCPLLQELDEIAKHSIKSHTILIDDIRLLGTAEFNYLTLDQVLQKLFQINPNYHIGYENGHVPKDILVACLHKPDVLSTPVEIYYGCDDIWVRVDETKCISANGYKLPSGDINRARLFQCDPVVGVVKQVKLHFPATSQTVTIFDDEEVHFNDIEICSEYTL
jgi:FkbM family methyltransferase